MEPAARSASPPYSPRDGRAFAVPHNIAVLLHAVGILLEYGHHLIDTVRHRATAPNFPAIAACFGTANLTTILAHLNRGILRAVALERVLLARAATGNDIDFAKPRTPAPQQLPTSAEATEPAAICKRAPRASRPAGRDDPELFMPTLKDLEQLARRRPVGLTIRDICIDLAVVPGLCHSAYWNELFELITYFGSNVGKVMQEKFRRERAFCKEQDHKPDANWDWLSMSRDALRQVLGFFIGEPPVNPLDPAAAIATAPP
jgi:hypothetical protein